MVVPWNMSITHYILVKQESLLYRKDRQYTLMTKHQQTISNLLHAV